MELQAAQLSALVADARGREDESRGGAPPPAENIDTILVKVPPGYATGARMQIQLPDGRTIAFVVPETGQGAGMDRHVQLKIPPVVERVRGALQSAGSRIGRAVSPARGEGGGRTHAGGSVSPGRSLRNIGERISRVVSPGRSRTGGGGGSNWFGSGRSPSPEIAARRRPSSARGTGGGSGVRESKSRLKYQQRIVEAEATLHTLESWGESTAEVERELKAMRAIVAKEDDLMRSAETSSYAESTEVAQRRRVEDKELARAVKASHETALEDEQRRKQALAKEIDQLSLLLSMADKDTPQKPSGPGSEWPIITPDLARQYGAFFDSLAMMPNSAPECRLASPAAVWDLLTKSGLQADALQHICSLAFGNPSEGVILSEFELVMHLTKGATTGLALPHRLPAHLTFVDREQQTADNRIRALEHMLSQAKVAGGSADGFTDESVQLRLQNMENELVGLRREKAALQAAAAETPAAGAVMAAGGGGGLSAGEVSALRAKVALLQQQLSELQPEDGEAEGSWDGSLESAQEGLRACAEKLMEGDESAQGEFDLWDRRISTHPDHLAEEARKMAEWENLERPHFAAALEQLRALIPATILRSSRAALESSGMPAKLSQRLWEKRVLWFVRMQPAAIAKVHFADLSTKYSFHGGHASVSVVVRLACGRRADAGDVLAVV
jgi:hypothetical protein